MAVVSTNTEDRYWIVTDVDPRDDGKFDINLKQVEDFQGTPSAVKPAARRTITRNQAVATGTIVKVTETATVDRTIVVSPTS